MDCFEKQHLHDAPASVAGELHLTFSERTRSRGKAETLEGQEVCWFLNRGEYLGANDYLKSADGELFRVVPAPEKLSQVTTDDGFLLLRAAYHLGNRHVPLAVTPEALFYQKDHVLDDMVKGLGLSVATVEVPFQPEGGAYGDHPHSGGRHHH